MKINQYFYINNGSNDCVLHEKCLQRIHRESAQQLPTLWSILAFSSFISCFLSHSCTDFGSLSEVSSFSFLCSLVGHSPCKNADALSYTRLISYVTPFWIVSPEKRNATKAQASSLSVAACGCYGTKHQEKANCFCSPPLGRRVLWLLVRVLVWTMFLAIKLCQAVGPSVHLSSTTQSTAKVSY